MAQQRRELIGQGAADERSTTSEPSHGFTRLGDTLAAMDLRRRLAELAVEPSGGWPVSEQAPACRRCRGTRYLRPDVEHSDPRFGKPIACPDCNVETEARRRERTVEGLYAAASVRPLSPAQRAKTFAAWQRDPRSDEAYEAAAGFALHPSGWLVLSGVAGCGKTHLGLAVANDLIARQLVPARWFYTGQLVGYARSLVPLGGDFAFRLELECCPLLVLDDLGSFKLTEWAVLEFLEPLLDARYRDRLPTVITALGGPEDVKEALSQSIGRRMQDPSVSRHVRNGAPQWGAAV